MKPSNRYIINVFAAGFFVLILLSILLFWIRWTPEAIFQENKMFSVFTRLEPSGIVPAEADDPNIEEHSYIYTRLGDWTMYSLGVFRDIEAQPETHQQFGLVGIYIDYILEKDRRQNKNIWHTLYFDKKSGLYVYCDIFRQKQEAKTSWTRETHFYIGPKGISQSPEEGLGRFIKPLESQGSGAFIIFDKAQSRFFRINPKEQKVIEGPELPKDYRPIQIGQLFKNPEILGRLNFSPPLRKATPQERKDKNKTRSVTRSRNGERIVYVPVDEYAYTPFSEKYILVLDESGRIDKLDTETLAFAGAAGYLPAAPTFFGSEQSITPKDLLGYRVLPLASKDGEHKGLFVASTSREAYGLTLAAFDSNANLTASSRSKPPSRTLLLETPWGPALMIAKYLTENLQPPILSITSYFTASSFEAANGHQALLILPNSFVAMLARENGGNNIGGFFVAAFLIFPSIILAVLLAWHLRTDAATVGLSKRAKLCWTIATIALGLSAYITYRLTRPKDTLVTCANCGKLRRPDGTECHRCGSKWHVPELTPPAWRVIDTKSLS